MVDTRRAGCKSINSLCCDATFIACNKPPPKTPAGGGTTSLPWWDRWWWGRCSRGTALQIWPSSPSCRRDVHLFHNTSGTATCCTHSTWKVENKGEASKPYFQTGTEDVLLLLLLPLGIIKNQTNPESPETAKQEIYKHCSFVSHLLLLLHFWKHTHTQYSASAQKVHH